MSARKIGIIGEGRVGGALARGLTRAGYPVATVGNEPERVSSVAAGAEIVILAVPFPALDAVLREARDALAGKTVVDVTNVLSPKMDLALGFTTSGAEELQRKAPASRVVKAFNTVFAQHMENGRLGTQPLTAFVAGDDAGAKREVLDMARAIGFDAVDAGPLRNARLLEPMGYLNIQLGYALGMGTQIGFELLHPAKAA